MSEEPITVNATRQINVKKSEEEQAEDDKKRNARAEPKAEVDYEAFGDISWL